MDDPLVRQVTYDALPSQARFHNSEARFKGFSGPIGSGKSQALCQEVLRLTFQNPGRLGLIGAPTYTMLRDTTQVTLTAVLAEARIPYAFHKAENALTLTDTDSRIIFRSLDDYERLRGTNLAWFGVDELTYASEQAWIRLEGRLRDPKAGRLCGFAVWTPKGFDWVYQRFIDNPVEGYECIQAKPFENRHLLEKIPDFYERLKRSYDVAFYAQEVLGQYLNSREGLVYRAFDRSRNVEPIRYDEKDRLHWALDFNVNPMSSVVVQIRDDQVRVIDEIVLTRSATWEACSEFYRRYSEYPAGLTIYADACCSHMQTAGTSDKEIIQTFFRDQGARNVEYRIPKRNPAVRDRVALMNSKLFAADGAVRLIVHPRCRELIADFERVTWADGTSEIDKARDPRRTHLSDALGYLLWQEFQPRPSIGFRGEKILSF